MKKLFLIQRVHFRLLRNKFEEFTIHPGQLPMLMMLWKWEGITQRQIADKLDLRPATVAIMLQRMEKANLICRMQDKKDRRIQRVFLTEYGKVLMKRIREEFETTEAKAFEGFSEEELRTLGSFLDRMLNNLKNQFGGCCDDQGSCVS